MKSFSAFVVVAALSFLAGVSLMYVAPHLSWTSDMADQPSIKPQERPFLPPQESVPADLSTISLVQPQSVSEPPSSTGEASSHAHSQDAEPQGHAETGQGPGDPHAHTHASDVGHPHEADPGSQPHTTHEHSAGHAHTSAETHPDPPGDAHHHGTEPSHGHETDSGQAQQEEAAGHHQGGHQDHPHPQGDTDHHGTEPSHGPQSESSQPHHIPTAGKTHRHDAENGAEHGHAQGHGMTHGPELRNPIPFTAASVKQGQQLFGMYCLVCHGPEGKGGMPIAEKYPKIPQYTPNLLRQVSDSHMYSMLTSGHGPMPGYAEALSAEERWHTINYLRSLQGK
jgi:hypothetical protein